MTRSVVYSRRAGQQLTDLYLWIAEQSGFPERAEGFVSAVVDYCDGLADFPLVGLARDDLRPGLRTIGFRRRVVIAFAVTPETVMILGVHYGGRDHDALLRTVVD
ncbi:addiction module toxin RelE [Tersicoccus phoenicis]|uniref:Addiction module toxin RelE n=1 Tax=Tersicoccus phoenicis TaxID=554083 RepID=A0A1R1L755_9MICC|nr:type II toxin-antitoxin system RelE/ParE family toxin [Tersicoccus phoenicis]OMH23353.1 addiction module toxin RelE [Tersicoccus phoenicis]